MRMRTVLPLLAGLLVALAAGCSSKGDSDKSGTGGDKSGEGAQAKAQRVVIATNSEPDLLNPLFAEMAASREVIGFISRELTMHNENWELVPDLAEKIPTLENGGVRLIDTGAGEPDGGTAKKKKQKMEVIWHIRDDAVWEDGRPVTADDFVFAWQIQMDPTQEIIDRDLPQRIEKMEVKGKNRKILIVTWKQPFAFYAQFRNHYALPAHVLEPRYKKPGGGTNDMKKDPYGRKPLSNGPFKVKQWMPGQHITLVKNERYYRPAKLDEITVRIIPNNNAMESALLAGDIHAITPVGGLSVADIEDIKQRDGKEFSYHMVPGLVWAHIDFNIDDPWLTDKKLRQAVAHGVNREGIIEELYFGKYTLAHTFLPPRHWGYNSDVKTYPFDLEKAEALLDETGWRRPAAGKVREKDGDKLSLKLSAVSGIKDIEQLEQVIQSDLKTIGVDVQIDNKPAKVFFGELARYRKFPHMSFYSWIMDPTSFGNTLWQEDMIPSAQNSWQGQNYPGWRNREVTRMLEEVPTILDEGERRKMMVKVQDIWAEELPSIPMYFRPVVAVTVPELKGYRPTGTQTPVSWNSHEWELE